MLNIVPGFLAFLGPILTEIENGSATFTVGDYTVTVTASAGAPHHLTFGEAVVVAESLAFGGPASFSIGSVNVSVTEGIATKEPSPTAAAVVSHLAAVIDEHPTVTAETTATSRESADPLPASTAPSLPVQEADWKPKLGS